MKYHVLLLEDVTNYGRKGDLTHVAPGFARNFLLPKGVAIMATHATVKTQARLQSERAEQAKKDKAESEKSAAALKGKILSTVVKVDNDGHMYGSVSIADILTMLLNDGVKLEKKHVALHMPIKSLGNHQVTLKLPEDVMVQVTVEVKPDRIIEKKKKVKEEPKAEAAEGETVEGEEAKTEDQSESQPEE